MPHQVDILEALRDWRLTIVEVDGWRTRGSSSFDPHGHVLHHDVVPDQPGDDDHTPGIIVAGRPDLPGPLANFWLERDGNVHLCAAGRANHAGAGGWKGLNGNADVWGTEMNNLGTPADPWPEVQLEAMARLAACTAEFSGFGASMVCGHKEWATPPGRKSDPHTIDMDAFRRWVALQEPGGLNVQEIVDQLERNRQTEIKQGKLLRATLVNQFAKLRRTVAQTSAGQTEAKKDEAASQKILDDEDDDG